VERDAEKVQQHPDEFGQNRQQLGFQLSLGQSYQSHQKRRLDSN
jgi:hypothetical protein